MKGQERFVGRNSTPPFRPHRGFFTGYIYTVHTGLILFVFSCLRFLVAFQHLEVSICWQTVTLPGSAFTRLRCALDHKHADLDSLPRLVIF